LREHVGDRARIDVPQSIDQCVDCSRRWNVELRDEVLCVVDIIGRSPQDYFGTRDGNSDVGRLPRHGARDAMYIGLRHANGGGWIDRAGGWSLLGRIDRRNHCPDLLHVIGRGDCDERAVRCDKEPGRRKDGVKPHQDRCWRDDMQLLSVNGCCTRIAYIDPLEYGANGIGLSRLCDHNDRVRPTIYSDAKPGIESADDCRRSRRTNLVERHNDWYRARGGRCLTPWRSGYRCA
jgi:hypothetical protein